MTTPSKSEIVERARELWLQDRLRRGDTEAIQLTPEEEKFREEGFLLVAQQELMRDTDEYEEYLAKELGKNVEDMREKPNQVSNFDNHA